jgi:hypothetical protein
MGNASVLLEHVGKQVRTDSGKRVMRVLLDAYDAGRGSAVKELMARLLSQAKALREEDAEGEERDGF